MNQAWRAVLTMPGLLSPFRHGLFAWQLWSHKLLRWLALVPMAALLVVSVPLAAHGGVYRWALGLQIACYVLALVGWLMRGRADRPRVVNVPYYFLLVNIASLRGILEYYQGRTYATWATVREG